MNRIKVLLLFCVLLPAISNGQSVDTSQSASDKRKLRRVAIGAGVIYTGAMVGLNQLWYADNGHTSFRFFNDNREWKQVDKLGHFYAAFHISDGSSRVLKSMNVEERKANLIGAATAFAVLMPIEIFDGHSKAYGASVGDLIANTTGAGFFLLQQHLWSETRIHPKFSFHSTRFATKRPELLGDGFQEELLKDYNGQTYWLSADLDKFFRFPKWINFSVGYGAEGMVYARDHENKSAGFGTPYRQLYLALDWDLHHIRSRSKLVNTLLFVVNMMKLPAPTLAYDRKGISFHSLYF